ncbi:dienelactone hydrolase family protein [Variovorax sp. J22G21]|uniref:alpha/beta hydrolase n=1 Tax=Variovorax fucosicus TaxID=3053517 RepID=UPI00257825DF|nr:MULTISPECIES: dienelactone hydrolase family protein [unclassified Variovorax]MDM0039853.1 dienelactone hydrolase family protein [Variovorax sp. J22R193]MDM0064598.1 dienelactone hydrolase family protein [Variovorax sp. J22G21]
MSLAPIEIETGPNPTASVILMHGLGADGNDFVPICNELDLGAIGPVRFVFPNAPVMPVSINNGYPMPAWYDIYGADLVKREDEAGLRRSMAAIEGLIAAEKARGVPANRIVVAGFSQGCAMALLTGLRHAERLAGIVALSGYLPLAASTAAERSEANRDVPIFMGHGQRDGVVVIARATASRDALTALGYAVDWHMYPMEHSVCMEEIAELGKWLQRVLV